MKNSEHYRSDKLDDNERKIINHFSFFTSCNFQLTKCTNLTSTNPILQMGLKKIFPAVALVQVCVIKSERNKFGLFQVEQQLLFSRTEGLLRRACVGMCALQRVGGKIPLEPKNTEASWLKRTQTLGICPCTTGKAVTPRSDYHFNHVPGLLVLLKWFLLVSFPQWNKYVNLRVHKLLTPLPSALGSHIEVIFPLFFSFLLCGSVGSSVQENGHVLNERA